MTDLINKVNALRNAPHSEWSPLVKKVAVILCSPRSGSSLVKKVLEAHPDIASLDGEIEPFLPLTRNGFGYNSDSDSIEALSNKEALADNIFDDLTIESREFPSWDVLKKRWERRLLLQFPCLFSEEKEHDRLLQSLDEAQQEIGEYHGQDEIDLEETVLSKVFKNEPWRIRYYDGHGDARSDMFFDEPLKIEEPPFVSPRLWRRPLTRNDACTRTLLFKAPPDVYRIGLYEQLFPNAEIKYIHLTRGYAQTVNGLIDGWLSSKAFFSHNLKSFGAALDIKGYSDVVGFGKAWWKFDLPPNWREFTKANLEDVCLNQWSSAHQAVFASNAATVRVSFESFLAEPAAAIKKMTDYLGLGELQLQQNLPVVMAMEPPQKKRWRKRERQLLEMGKRKEVRELMSSLGYEMNPDTWV